MPLFIGEEVQALLQEDRRRESATEGEWKVSVGPSGDRYFDRMTVTLEDDCCRIMISDEEVLFGLRVGEIRHRNAGAKSYHYGFAVSFGETDLPISSVEASLAAALAWVRQHRERLEGSQK